MEYVLFLPIADEPISQLVLELGLSGLNSFFHHITSIFVGWEDDDIAEEDF